MSELTFQLMGERQEDEKNKPVKPFESMKNCPFCKRVDVTIRNSDEFEDGKMFYWGHCTSCQSNGPLRHDRHNAMRMWNGDFGNIENTAGTPRGK